MANRKQNREKGTGTIEKKRNHFYLKLRTGGKTKSTLLRDAAGKAVTTRKDAEAAAKLLNPVLRATQKEEIACYVAEARKLKREAALPEGVLREPQRVREAVREIARLYLPG